MKTVSLLGILSLFTFLLMATTCDDDLVEPNCDAHLASLSQLNDQIQSLITSSPCDVSSECRSIAYGSKPCGGPWQYLIYSTSIDTLQLQNLVEEYNNIESAYNAQCDVVSDCLFVGPPSNLACENGHCIAVE